MTCLLPRPGRRSGRPCASLRALLRSVLEPDSGRLLRLPFPEARAAWRFALRSSAPSWAQGRGWSRWGGKVRWAGREGHRRSGMSWARTRRTTCMTYRDWEARRSCCPSLVAWRWKYVRRRRRMCVRVCWMCCSLFGRGYEMSARMSVTRSSALCMLM